MEGPVPAVRDLGVLGFVREYGDLRAVALSVVFTLSTTTFVWVFAPAIGLLVGAFCGGYLHDGSERTAGWAGLISAFLATLATSLLFAGLVALWILLPEGGESANTGAPIVAGLLLAMLVSTVVAGVVLSPFGWAAGRLGGQLRRSRRAAPRAS